MRPIYWLGIFLIFIIIEAITKKYIAIWIGFGAMLAYILAGMNYGIGMQVGGFIAGSALMIVMSRPMARSREEAQRVKEHVNELIGKQGVVTEDVDTVNKGGAVEVNGESWLARTVNANGWIMKDTVIVVDGSYRDKLVVHEFGKDPDPEKEHEREKQMEQEQKEERKQARAQRRQQRRNKG